MKQPTIGGSAYVPQTTIDDAAPGPVHKDSSQPADR